MPVISTEADTVALLKRQDEIGDQADLDHDVAGAEAGEIDDGAELARVVAEDRAPAEERPGSAPARGAVRQAIASVAHSSR